MSKALLAVKDLCVSFQGDDEPVEVLHGVGFSLFEGDILGIVGESGSGKSVTSLAIMGLLPKPAGLITSGSIQFNSDEWVNAPAERYHSLRGNRISMIFQEPMSALNPVQRIGVQLAEVFKLHFPDKSPEQIKSASLELLTQVGIKDPLVRLQAYPHMLSGGICQRVMIAMALACRPDILIADEPSTALDVTTQKQILSLIKELQPVFGMSVIFITHDLGVVAQLCNRVVVMEQGYVRESNTVERLFHEPQHHYTQSLLSAIIHLNSPPMSQLLKGASDKAVVTRDKTVLLTVSNLVKKHPSKNGIFSWMKEWHTAVKGVSFELYEGEILGLVGESGCGKSTLGRAILQLDPQTAGDIIFDNKNLAALNKSQQRQFRRDIQVIFQDTNESLNARHTIGTILEEPFVIHKQGTAAERHAWVAQLLEKVDLPADSIHRFPHEFSGGQRQRIGIARAIALKPKLIICDEPVSALDVSTQNQVLTLLCQLKRDLNLSLLFISHDLAVVKHISDRVLVMKSGEIVESNSAEQIYQKPQHHYTKLLIDSIPEPQVPCP